MKLVEFLSPDFSYSNENGLLIQLVHDGWKQVNVIFSKSNSIRGGHYHKYNEEVFYVIRGAFCLSVWKSEQRETYQITAGDMFLIHRQAFHTFEYTADTWLVSMYSNGVELDEDIKDIWTE